MELQIHQREEQGIRILDLRGPLTIGASEELLRTTMVALAASGAVNVIVNLQHTAEIDDDGLGALVYCQARLARSGGALKLLHLSQLHVNLMVLTKLDTVFEFFAEEQDAVDSFFPDRAVHRYDILEVVEEQKKGPAETLK